MNKRIPFEILVRFGTALLEKKSVNKELALEMSELAVRAQASGTQTHGIKMFLFLIGSMDARTESGQLILDPLAVPVIIKEAAGSAVIDAQWGFGHPAMKLALQTAMQKAKICGISMVGVINSNWIGSLGVYALQVAEQGFLAQLWSQSTRCKDVAPLGGREARFGTNPVCMAVPTGGDPMVADMSTAVQSAGKTWQMIERRQSATDEIFMDKNGNFTNDPQVFADKGSMLFLGGRHYGHKGYGLSFWAESLIGMAGGRMNHPDIYAHNMNLTVIDPEAFGGRDVFIQEMERFIEHVKSSALQPGVKGIRYPGERMAEAIRTAMKQGVIVDDGLVEKLNDAAAKLGLEQRL
jgi:L-lactate dehydrogenase